MSEGNTFSLKHREKAGTFEDPPQRDTIFLLGEGWLDWTQKIHIDRVSMLEHNRVMNVSHKDWIHVNRFIRSVSPKGSSQDRISEVDRIAGLEPVIIGYLPACVLDRII